MSITALSRRARSVLRQALGTYEGWDEFEAFLDAVDVQTDDNTARIAAREVGARLDIDDGSVPAILYVDSVAGDDTTGDGTAVAPYASIGRAIRECPVFATITRTIQLVGTGPYVFPGLSATDWNWITIKGQAPTVLDTRTITSVGASSAANGLLLTDADPAVGIDGYRASLVKFTSGTLNNQYGWCYENSANTFEITQDTQGATYKIPSPGDTYDVYDYAQMTEIQFPLGTSYFLEACGQLAFEDVKFSGTNKFLFVSNTEKVDFRRCLFEITSLLAGRGGSLFLTTSYVFNAGSNFKDWGMMTAITGGIIEINKGSVVDGNKGNRFVSCMDMSMYSTFGDVVWRDLGTKAVTVRHGVISTVRDRLGSVFSHWRFVDCDKAVNVNAYNNAEGWGWGAADLPDLYGNCTEDFAVIGFGGAKIQLGASSNIATNTVPNAVTVNSVDAGASDQHGTMILNGDPAFQGFARHHLQSFVNADLSAGVLTITHNLQQQYVMVAIYDNNGVQVAPDSVDCTGANTLAVDLTTQGVLTGTWQAVVIA